VGEQEFSLFFTVLLDALCCFGHLFGHISESEMMLSTEAIMSKLALERLGFSLGFPVRNNLTYLCEDLL
jgi:hypothetical protein